MNDILVVVLLGLGATIGTTGWVIGRAKLATSAVLLLVVTAAVLVAALDDSGRPDRAEHLLLISLGAAVALSGGALVTTTVFALVDRDTQPPAANMASAAAILRGGAWIGALERLAIFASLLAGWPEGLAIALGLKGLGRYPELRNQEHTATAERFIIGTFTSVLWAVACAGVVTLASRS